MRMIFEADVCKISYFIVFVLKASILFSECIWDVVGKRIQVLASTLPFLSHLMWIWLEMLC